MLLIACALLAGCASQDTGGDLPDASGPVAAPAGAAPGTCWGRADSPNAIRTVVREVEVVPPETGPDGVVRPGIYRRAEVRELVSPGEGSLFEIPCPGTLVPDFTASLQRALRARGTYDGPITGRADRATRAAIRAFQAPLGIDSAQVSRRMAEELGLAVVRRPD